jgi:hypothetical protein
MLYLTPLAGEGGVTELSCLALPLFAVVILIQAEPIHCIVQILKGPVVADRL